MINPEKITNYDLTDSELEETILFWVCAAGKNGTTSARVLELFLTKITYNGMTPFEAIRDKDSDDTLEEIEGYKTLSDLMKESGIGCYTHKSRTFSELVYSELDLKTCTAEDLEKIYGIGMKTSRCFLMHSRKGVQLAGLDTHMLKNLRAAGVKNVPKATPTSKKQYKLLELEVLKLATGAGLTPADYDLKVWNTYAIR